MTEATENSIENQTGALQIEVTPEMVDAGFEVYAGAHPGTYVESVDRITVSNIYRAMILARSGRMSDALGREIES